MSNHNTKNMPRWYIAELKRFAYQDEILQRREMGQKVELGDLTGEEQETAVRDVFALMSVFGGDSKIEVFKKCPLAK